MQSGNLKSRGEPDPTRRGGPAIPDVGGRRR